MGRIALCEWTASTVTGSVTPAKSRLPCAHRRGPRHKDQHQPRLCAAGHGVGERHLGSPRALRQGAAQEVPPRHSSRAHQPRPNGRRGGGSERHWGQRSGAAPRQQRIPGAANQLAVAAAGGCQLECVRRGNAWHEWCITLCTGTGCCAAAGSCSRWYSTGRAVSCCNGSRPTSGLSSPCTQCTPAAASSSATRCCPAVSAVGACWGQCTANSTGGTGCGCAAASSASGVWCCSASTSGQRAGSSANGATSTCTCPAA